MISMSHCGTEVKRSGVALIERYMSCIVSARAPVNTKTIVGFEMAKAVCC